GGVNQTTDIEGTADTTWTVTFVDGVYQFQCDAHVTVMHGTFRVGAAPPPPPPKPKPVALAAKVGPGKAIAVTRGGSKLKAVKAGKAKLTVRDLSAKDN